MIRVFRWYLYICFIVSAIVEPVSADNKTPLIGECEKVYTLAGENREIRGLAFDDISPDAPRLCVLDSLGKIFVYKVYEAPDENTDKLELLETYELPLEADTPPLASPRGLAYAWDGNQSFFYFLNWDNSEKEIKSQLWRCNFKAGDHSSANLTLYKLRIGQREVIDLAYDNGNILVCFDASGYKDNNLRVQRGILVLKWVQANNAQPEFVKHLPDSGEFTSRGLTFMEFEGARYLWATAGNDYIYSAQARTGRGLFFFDRPKSTSQDIPCWGLTFGRNSLWVPENVNGPGLVHRVNVTRNLDAFCEGPRILRHLTMTIQSEPESDCADPGKVYHYYSRPYAYDQLHNQGTWPETEKLRDISDVPNAEIKQFTYDPAGDISSRQNMSLVEYANAPARKYSSQYEIDIWTNPYRKYIYPHRVNKNSDSLSGTNYLEDDPELFNLTDTKTYKSFFARIETHIEKKYGFPANMDNPYWAARNALEYIQDHYYYPGRAQGKPATVDYERKHYDANPGNLKIELSDRDYDKTQIIACSGTSVMLAGAMRYLGYPARWLGTGTEKNPAIWDTNDNGLLDEDESAPCTSGHRYTQVWLGSNYGWICFDATPTRPDFGDYDPPPPIKSQWRYMNRAAKGHLLDKRIVFNVGSKLFRPLYRDFEYDDKLAVDNNCGGDQRYNLQGRFEKPELWKMARQSISVKNLCFIKGVTIAGPRDKTQVTWKLEGDWLKDPKAKISIYLQQITSKTNKPKLVTKLAEAIPYNDEKALISLSPYKGKQYRILLRKDGDSETGGYSETFDLE